MDDMKGRGRFVPQLAKLPCEETDYFGVSQAVGKGTFLLKITPTSNIITFLQALLTQENFSHSLTQKSRKWSEIYIVFIKDI